MIMRIGHRDAKTVGQIATVAGTLDEGSNYLPTCKINLIKVKMRDNTHWYYLAGHQNDITELIEHFMIVPMWSSAPHDSNVRDWDTCYHCNRRVWASDMVSDEDTTLCQACYDREYYRCEACGMLTHKRENDCDDLCEDCREAWSQKCKEDELP